MKGCILAIDQSTQGTKGVVFGSDGTLLARADRPHAQKIDANGWVEHDPEEILANTLAVARDALEKAGIDRKDLAAVGISNQRETVVAWDRTTGKPLYNAIVWQCGRAKDLCAELSGAAGMVQKKTGLPLSPYFSAPKLAWMLRFVPAVCAAAKAGTLCCGTVDSWLLWNLTRERVLRTDCSNASRTGLFNIHTLEWDEELCALYGVPRAALAEVCMSDAVFGTTDLGGLLDSPVPVCGVLGDSHAALLGQGCFAPGTVKATYGTGSSVMMQTGDACIPSPGGLVTSLAWGLGGKVGYVLEGNLNYTGAVITWLKRDVGLLETDAESEQLARQANPGDRTYFVPAFTGLGAPYWDSEATGLLTGVTRTTGRAEIVRACLDSIAYQITDLLRRMQTDAGLPLTELRVDGGPTANRYLMQRQSDLADLPLAVPAVQELSALGAARAAAQGAGLCGCGEFGHPAYTRYRPEMDPAQRKKLYGGWLDAVDRTLYHGKKTTRPGTDQDRI